MEHPNGSNASHIGGEDTAVFIHRNSIRKGTKGSDNNMGSVILPQAESSNQHIGCKRKVCGGIILLGGLFLSMAFLAGGIVMMNKCEDDNSLPALLICKY